MPSISKSKSKEKQKKNFDCDRELIKLWYKKVSDARAGAVGMSPKNLKKKN